MGGKGAGVAALLLVTVAVPATPAQATQEVRVSISAQWITMVFDLTGAPFQFQLKGSVTCEKEPLCFIYAIRFGERVGPYYAYARSAPGIDASAKVAGVSAVDLHVPTGDPLTITINWSRSSDPEFWGSWHGLAILAPEPGAFDLWISDVTAVREVSYGTSGVRWLYPNDFDAPLDVHAAVALGVDHTLTLHSRHGLVGVYTPDDGEGPPFSLTTQAGFLSPTEERQCLAVGAWVGFIGIATFGGACTFTLRGPAGLWRFWASNRVRGSFSTLLSDEIWMVYLDAPTLLARM